MPAAALGVKRRCLSCATPFYDLNHSPILCPKCGVQFQVVELPHQAPMRARARVPMPVAPIEAEKADPQETSEEDANGEDDIPEIDDDDDADVEAIVEAERDEGTPQA